MTEGGGNKARRRDQARRPQEEQGVGEECGGKLGQRCHGLISVLTRSPWLPCGEAELIRTSFLPSLQSIALPCLHSLRRQTWTPRKQDLNLTPPPAQGQRGICLWVKLS